MQVRYNFETGESGETQYSSDTDGMILTNDVNDNIACYRIYRYKGYDVLEEMDGTSEIYDLDANEIEIKDNLTEAKQYIDSIT